MHMADLVDDILRRALSEDIGPGDVTTESTVPPGTRASGEFRAKDSGVVAGTAVAGRVFELLCAGRPGEEAELVWNVADGERVSRGTVIGRISGSARTILTGERTALNILQRMSGIATATAGLVEAVKGTGAVILDTRKTVPGLRLLDKMAVKVGGGRNHRVGLFDMVLIKDNHIVAAGSIEDAIGRARRLLDQRQEHEIKIEVEARTLAEVRRVIAHRERTGDPDRIMLDNMVRLREGGRVDTTMLQEAIAIIDHRLETEASGNVTLDTVGAIAETGVDFISVGSITHSVRALDISLEMVVAG